MFPRPSPVTEIVALLRVRFSNPQDKRVAIVPLDLSWVGKISSSIIAARENIAEGSGAGLKPSRQTYTFSRLPITKPPIPGVLWGEQAKLLHEPLGTIGAPFNNHCQFSTLDKQTLDRLKTHKFYKSELEIDDSHFWWSSGDPHTGAHWYTSRVPQEIAFNLELILSPEESYGSVLKKVSDFSPYLLAGFLQNGVSLNPFPEVSNEKLLEALDQESLAKVLLIEDSKSRREVFRLLDSIGRHAPTLPAS